MIKLFKTKICTYEKRLEEGVLRRKKMNALFLNLKTFSSVFFKISLISVLLIYTGNIRPCSSIVELTTNSTTNNKNPNGLKI